jgi:hypothetical protein
MVAHALLPAWQARWRQALAYWSGNISLIIGEDTCTLHIEGTNLHLVDSPIRDATAVKLSPQLFTQLVFGYRSVDSTLEQGEQARPGEVAAALNVLFPYGHTWIPSSDWF